jgi:hypothetical protein
VTTDHRGLTLGSPPDKEFVRIGGPTKGFGYPGEPFLRVDSAEIARCSREVCSPSGGSCS